MKDETTGGVHWSFWLIGAVGLIWNVMGRHEFLRANECGRRTPPPRHPDIGP